MVAVCSYPIESEVVAHAIFWRPLAYFTMQPRKDFDDLDEFEGATFMIGNEISFDLRKYAGHPDFTVSVYLPMQVEDLEEINKIIDRVITEFAIQPIDYSKRKRKFCSLRSRHCSRAAGLQPRSSRTPKRAALAANCRQCNCSQVTF